ncbi:MAG: hypothetical protein GC145_19255 [Caulobacter sp.]|nr:hypothetical protein [Caulobacter sp.]
MPGIGRTTKAGKARVEFMRIDEAADGGLVFTAILPGQPPTPFAARTLAADRVEFENLDHDYPQRVIYARCGADLCAAIEGEQGGEIKRIDWRYSRVPD